MQDDAEAEKGGPEFDGNASALKETQRQKAGDLLKSQTKTARALDAHNKKDAADLLNNDGEIKETPEEARRYAADALASSQRKAAAMLKDSQSRAASALADSQTEAASALRASRSQDREKHDDKDKVITWLSGGYSVSGEPDKK